MLAPPLPVLVRHFTALVQRLVLAIGLHRVGGVLHGQVPGPLVAPISERIKAFCNRFARLAARIVAGSYRPRRTAGPPHRKPLAPRPWQATPFRKSGWLDAMLPPEVAREYRAGLFGLLQEPEIAALVRAAPGPMGRILRPLCWMLKLKPPEILARPRRGTEPPAPVPYQPPPPPAPPLPGPANMLGLSPIQLAPPPGAPPKPA
jgi:hypothetical protein